jgi:hypothetical protein
MTQFGTRPVIAGSKFFPRQPLPGITDMVIIDACKRFGVTRNGLLGKCREKRLVSARAYAADRLVNALGYSRPKAGRVLHRHHTTIVNLLLKNVRGMKAQPKASAVLAAEVRRLFTEHHMDTLAIALRLNCTEAQVYNALHTSVNERRLSTPDSAAPLADAPLTGD